MSNFKRSENDLDDNKAGSWTGLMRKVNAHWGFAKCQGG